MTKNELIKILKEQKLSETLMNDEKFRKEALEILKKEIPNATESDLKNILMVTEKVLSGEVKIANDDELSGVIGGINDTSKKVAAGAIIASSTAGVAWLAGKPVAAIGEILGELSGTSIQTAAGIMSGNSDIDIDKGAKIGGKIGKITGGALGGSVGLGYGAVLGCLICRALEIF